MDMCRVVSEGDEEVTWERCHCLGWEQGYMSVCIYEQMNEERMNDSVENSHIADIQFSLPYKFPWFLLLGRNFALQTNANALFLGLSLSFSLFP